MTRSRIGWLIALLLAVAALALLRDREVTDARTMAAVLDTQPANAPPSAAATLPEGTPPGNDVAMRDALLTLREYVALLPADLPKADVYWAGGTPPRNAREADLRSLPAPPVRFKLTSRAAEAFSQLPEGGEVQIPIELLLAYREEPSRRYEGWYRLRMKDGGGWEITGAAVDAVPSRQ